MYMYMYMYELDKLSCGLLEGRVKRCLRLAALAEVVVVCFQASLVR